jgi:hypothetical protein
MESDYAGASAREEYERRRAARERRVRERHPHIGRLLVAFAEAPASERVWDEGAEPLRAGSAGAGEGV